MISTYIYSTFVSAWKPCKVQTGIFKNDGEYMAKQSVKEKSVKKKTRKEEALSLEPINYKIIIAGVLVIILGYIALSMSPWDGFMPLTVAPILLVMGYCVIVPVGIIYRRKKSNEEVTTVSTEQTV